MILRHTRLVACLLASGLTTSSVLAEPSRSTYIIEFDEPAAAVFTEMRQIKDASKATFLRPTAIEVTGKRRLDARDIFVARYRDYLAGRHEGFLSESGQRIGRNLKATAQWDLAMNGMSVTLTAAEAETLSHQPGVRSIVPETFHRLATGISTRYVGADALWLGQVPDFSGGVRGEGVVVGIIDSGINTAHPSFADLSPDGYNHTNPRGTRFGLCTNGGETRCNDKLIGIYDYVNENGATGALAGKDIDGHGTHVASTAAGNPLAVTLTGSGFQLQTSITGVAPRANVIAYKVCQQNGDEPVTCGTGPILSAVNQAIADGVDVVNYSIGGQPNQSPWTENSGISTAFLNARQAGIIMVVSAGNHSPTESSAVEVPAYAPWVMAIANTTSNGQFSTVLAQINGTGINAPFDLTGMALSNGVTEAEVVYAGDFGNALCGVGETQGTSPTGQSNPFPAGTFNGKIVVCDRGVYARVEKGFNVRQAGAVGYVLANTSAEGNALVLDEHFLPSVHLSFTDGDRIKSAIRTARASSGFVRAHIDGVQYSTSGQGSVLNTSSNTGPVSTYNNVQKPDLAAPGTNIFAAYVPDANSVDTLTGTSMASPHVAGAAALMVAANPTWSVDQVISALMTSATRNVVADDRVSPTRFFESGSGMLDIPKAVNAGLFLPVTRQQFIDANPGAGGEPADLNLPTMHRIRCESSCSFTRRFTANVGGTWTASATLSAGTAQIQPNTIQLAAGQTAAITITITPPQGGAGWIEGFLRLAPSGASGQVTNTELPISVFSPIDFESQIVTIENVTIQGTGVINLLPNVAADDLIVRDSELKPFESLPINVGQDPTAQDPYDMTIHNFTRLITRLTAAPGVDTSRSYMFLETGSNNNQDIDLFVGIDLNGDGVPQLSEELCRSTTNGPVEQCLVRAQFDTPTIQYWAMVQGFSASGSGNDQPRLAVFHGLRDGGADLGFSAQAQRGKLVAGQHVPVALSWNLPGVPAFGSALAMVAYGSDRTTPENLGVVPIVLKRSTAQQIAPVILKATRDSHTFVLPAGQAHERMIVDVPPNVGTMVLRTSSVGGTIDLYVSRVTTAGIGPGIPPAPARDNQPFRSLSVGNDEVIALEGATMVPGRYHITPVNTGSVSAIVTVTLEAERTGNTIQPAANGYFNPARSGHGVFLAKTPQVWALAWYTFDVPGKPIWYTAQGAAAAPGDGVWTAPIYRSTWNGVRDNPQQVGEVVLTFDGTGNFTYSWFVDGQYGSEPFVPIGTPLCANGNFPVGGGWLRPDQPGWGSYFLDFAGNFEAEAIYVYDNDGLPRWLIGDGTYATTLQKNLFQVSGFCPTCAAVPTTRTAVGTASRTLNTSTTGTFSSNIVFADGVAGSWLQNNVSWVKLTPDMSCQ